MPVAAGEARHEPGHIRLAPERQGGQLQTGRPPFGPGRQRGHRVVGQLGPDRSAQQGPRLLRHEAQVGGAQLGQLPPRSQPRQRQGRVGAAGQQELQFPRPMLEQKGHRRVHRLGVDQVVVVQDQDLALTRSGRQLVDQRRHQRLERRRRRRSEQRGNLLGESRPCPVQRRGGVAPEPGRVVVAGVQRQPCDRPPAVVGPVGQQRGLAEPGRGTDQDQAARQALVQPLHEAWAGRKARLGRRRTELGCQQDILLGRNSLRRGRPGRLSHR